ncbi:hypothetical protein OF83DRAFT_1113177 [Amylostereum chailletii]|nr:hypothetical protein OF83DRAFT_1113177 [Amylostereum chailletii]
MMAFFSIVPALAVFPACSRAAYILMGQFIAHTRVTGRTHCGPNPSPFNQHYTGRPAVDGILCFLVAFFHASFTAPVFPLVTTFGALLAPLVLLPTIEGSRASRSLIFTPLVTVAFGLAYQLKGAGALFPLFWLAMVLSGHARMHARPAAARGSSIDQAHAEANLFALVVGYLAPSVAMCVLEDPKMTALWQPFPVWIALARALYLLLRPRARSSGYFTVQATFALTFALSAVVHVHTAWSLRQDLSALALAFIPRVAPPIGEDTLLPLPMAALGMLQWDMYATLGSGILGALWFADSIGQGVGVLLWSVGASLGLGPGAAISALLMWRESKLNGRAKKNGLKRS